MNSKMLRRLLFALVCGAYSLAGSGCIPIDWQQENLTAWLHRGTLNVTHSLW